MTPLYGARMPRRGRPYRRVSMPVYATDHPGVRRIVKNSLKAGTIWVREPQTRPIHGAKKGVSYVQYR